MVLLNNTVLVSHDKMASCIHTLIWLMFLQKYSRPIIIIVLRDENNYIFSPRSSVI